MKVGLKTTQFISFLALALIGFNLQAAVDNKTLYNLRTEWAVIKYQTAKSKQAPFFQKLKQQAQELLQKNPDDAHLKVWYATILSSDAALKGGVSVLPEVKKAKALLEEAINQDPQIEQGFAHGVLGALYARVPAWPLAFGNKKKAREHLEMAVKIDPNGSDTNYYLGDYLVDVGDYAAARKHLQTAQRAQIRPEYDVQDRGRKGEIAVSLNKLNRLGR